MDRLRESELTVEPRDAEVLREGLGRPAMEQIERAMEEVERQIALEDLVIVLVESTREAVRAFFDLLSEIGTDQHWDSRPDIEPGEDT